MSERFEQRVESAALDQVKATLKFYANPKIYKQREANNHPGPRTSAERDAGDRARSALLALNRSRST